MRDLEGRKIELKEALASQKQLDFQAAFFARSHRTYAALGANRSGKSIVAGVLCFAKELRDYARHGFRYWCVAPTFEKSLGQQRLLWETLPRAMFGDFVFDEKNGFAGDRAIVTLQLPGGRGQCVVHFKNSAQGAATFEQEAINGAWADERLPQEYFQRLIPRTIDRRGWILYSDIPEQAWHYFELLQAKPEAKVYCRVFAMHDNESNLPEGEIELAMARLTEDERKMRVFGQFRMLSGLVIKEFEQAVHVMRPFPIPSEGPYPSVTNWPRWRLIDYGGSSPTACSWVALAPNERAYVYREYYQRGSNIAKHAAAIQEISLDQRGRREEYINTLLDPHAWDTSPGNDINLAQQYALAGVPTSPWPYMNIFGERAAVEILKMRFQVNQIMIFDTCTNLIHELCSWKYKTDAEGNPLATDVYENGNNHLIDGLKGFFATRPTFTVSGIVRRR